jgi:type I restriction enzyme R subunit
VVETKDEKTGRKKRRRSSRATTSSTSCASCWPMPVATGAGKRYLIQHSAGSGKSNSIAWLAHQLIGLERRTGRRVFDSIIVVTDRRILDKQIRDTIKQFAQVGATLGHAEHSGDLRRFIAGGKKIIISTVQKFPFILDEIGNEQRGRRSRSSSTRPTPARAGAPARPWPRRSPRHGAEVEAEDETFEDQINRLMESRKMLPNASYFAFTATPKNKTLEIFGEPDPQGDGKVKHHPSTPTR